MGLKAASITGEPCADGTQPVVSAKGRKRKGKGKGKGKDKGKDKGKGKGKGKEKGKGKKGAAVPAEPAEPSEPLEPPAPVESPNPPKAPKKPKAAAKSAAKAKAKASKRPAEDPDPSPASSGSAVAPKSKAERKRKVAPRVEVSQEVAEPEGECVGKGLKCFARRRRPASSFPALKWDSIRQAFQRKVMPLLTTYSAHEDCIFESCMHHIYNILILNCRDAFIDALCASIWGMAGLWV